MKKILIHSSLSLLLFSCSSPLEESEEELSSEAVSAVSSGLELSINTQSDAANSSSLIVLSSSSDTNSNVDKNSSGAPLSSAELQSSSQIVTTDRPDGWTTATHDKSADADYGVLFPNDKVNRIDIHMTHAQWDAIVEDLSTTLGRDLGRFSQTIPEYTKSASDVVVLGEKKEGDPIYTPVDVEFNGKKWEKVGFRFKGHSSISSAATTGILKFPFKLDFDEFEEAYPQIDDQRFYGVKKIGFGSNVADPSMMREMYASKAFTAYGIPNTHRSFYEIWIDLGLESGPFNFGIYTATEMPAGELLNHLFGNSDGNLYKPEPSTVREPGQLKSSVGVDQESFSKKTNKTSSTWDDIISAIDALNNTSVTGAAWRTELEKHINVPDFMKWLAANTVLECGDSYGGAPHNYYLYGDTEKQGQLQWIPYDFDFCSSGQSPRSLDQSDVGAAWPLIHLTMQDPVYSKIYWDSMNEFNTQHFNVSQITAQMDNWRTMLKPYVDKELQGLSNYWVIVQSTGLFDSDYSQLTSLISNRKSLVNQELANRGY